MTARAEVIITDDRALGALGHPRTLYQRFEDPREAARIASSLNAAAADIGLAADLAADDL